MSKKLEFVKSDLDILRSDTFFVLSPLNYEGCDGGRDEGYEARTCNEQVREVLHILFWFLIYFFFWLKNHHAESYSIPQHSLGLHGIYV